MTKVAGFFHGYSLYNIPEPGLCGPDPLGRKWPMNFQKVCWGDPDNGLMGRIPAFLSKAIRMRPAPELLIWSTTSTCTIDGIWESQYAFEMAIKNLSRLWRDFPHHFADNPGRCTDWIRGISHIETPATNPDRRQSINTATSIELAVPRLNRFFNDGPGILFHTTSADHMSRADRDMRSVLYDGQVVEGFDDDDNVRKRQVQGLRNPGRIEIEGVSAVTCYGGKDSSETRVDDTGSLLVPKKKK